LPAPPSEALRRLRNLLTGAGLSTEKIIFLSGTLGDPNRAPGRPRFIAAGRFDILIPSPVPSSVISSSTAQLARKTAAFASQRRYKSFTSGRFDSICEACVHLEKLKEPTFSAPENAESMKPHGAHRSSISLAAALAVSLAAALAAASSASSFGSEPPVPAQNACGSPGSPPCPLQAWMRETIALPLATNNLSDLADGLERTARLSPDMAWESWRTIASQGAAAARKGDINRARAACKACHDTWREAYKAKFRKRPIQR